MHRSPLQVSALTALLATLLLGPTLVHAQNQPGTPAATTRYEVTDLGTLGGDYSEANGLNAAGQVVGSSTTAPGQEPFGPGTRAFLWTAGEMTDLGTLGGRSARPSTSMTPARSLASPRRPKEPSSPSSGPMGR